MHFAFSCTVLDRAFHFLPGGSKEELRVKRDRSGGGGGGQTVKQAKERATFKRQKITSSLCSAGIHLVIFLLALAAYHARVFFYPFCRKNWFMHGLLPTLI
jgi:hypothetical protein